MNFVKGLGKSYPILVPTKSYVGYAMPNLKEDLYMY